jgi:hypothetical protein
MKRDIKRTRTVYECELKIYKKNRNSLAKWCLIKAEEQPCKVVPYKSRNNQQHSSATFLYLLLENIKYITMQ